MVKSASREDSQFTMSCTNTPVKQEPSLYDCPGAQRFACRRESLRHLCTKEHRILNGRQKCQLWLSLAVAAALVGSCGMVVAQAKDSQTRTFTLEEALDFALKNYPAIRASEERVSGAQAGVSLARTEYLPRLDMLWQGNRATRNNTFGLLFPQTTIPSISGPVLPTTSNEGVWGSAAGLLFSWEPFDFGRREAEVNTARKVESRISAEVSVTRLDVAFATGYAKYRQRDYRWSVSCSHKRKSRVLQYVHSHGRRRRECNCTIHVSGTWTGNELSSLCHHLLVR